jgi:RNA polymerase sigma factor (sigma-70 family)
VTSVHMGSALRQIQGLFEVGTVAGLTDGQLLERYLASRDESAFAALVVRHGPMVLGVCRSVLNNAPEVEDAFQATFLVLIRKAGTIRGRDAVGAWLHRVAQRVAVQAVLERSRKDLHEPGVGDLSALVVAGEAPADEDWRAPLHEEVARLPERFRLPIVMCYLEGKTHAQAARELRWGEATVRRRLADARDLLRSRLTRRGVAVSSGALAATLASEATAAVPAGWVEVMARIAAGRAATKTAARLAETLVQGMLVGKIQSFATVVMLLFAASLVAPHLVPTTPVKAGDGAAVQSTPAAVSAPPAQTRTSPKQPVEPEHSLAVFGRVLDPDNKPFAGAKVYSYRQLPREVDIFALLPPAPDAISDADGRFRFQIADPGFLSLQEQATWSHPTVAAIARGFGPAWAGFTTADGAKEVTLKLVRDEVPIVGRVIDLEGRPIPGVTVRPVVVLADLMKNLVAWETAMASAKTIRDGALSKLPNALELYRWRTEFDVTTGPDGRFRMTGIGRERVVSLWIEGPTIATSLATIHARTRPGPTFGLAAERDKPEFGTLVFYGATFDHVAAPTRPIEGTVRDKDSGKPLAGISIRSFRFAGSVISGSDHVRTTTGPDGRFRLVGMPGGAGNVITASAGPALPYLGASAEVSAGSVPEPATVDFALKRGVAIRGKVSDKTTGKPVPSLVEYFVFTDNPHHADASRLHGGPVTTRPDGSFELIGLPGRGLIAARAFKDYYVVGRGVEKIAGLDERGWFRTEPHLCQPEQIHTVVEIAPAERAESLTCDLAFDPGKTRSGVVEGPDGKPVEGCVALNLCPHTMSFNIVKLQSSEFDASALEPKQSRPLFFRHDEKKLAGVVIAKGDDSGPLHVRLELAGTVTGRLIEDDGPLRPGILIDVNFGKGQFGDRYYWSYLQPTIGADGRFRIEGLIPGVSYELFTRMGNAHLGEFATGLKLKPGETRDLGDVKVEGKSIK